jgi:hypothetical protein
MPFFICVLQGHEFELAIGVQEADSASETSAWSTIGVVGKKVSLQLDIPGSCTCIKE